MSQSFIEVIAAFDQAVNSLSYLKGELFIGGSFQTNISVQSANFLARQGFPVGKNDFSPDYTFDVYPNPFTTSIHLEGVRNRMAYSILNIDGRMLKTGIVMNEEKNDLDLLPDGVFLLRFEFINGLIVKKIVK